MYLNFINYFRGFAILLIVMGHLFEITKVFDYNNPQLNSLFTKICFPLITGGTALFVFISGFLFHHIFYARGFNLKEFLKNKVKNVLCPYLFSITPIIVYRLFFNHKNLNFYENKIKFLKTLALNFYSGTLLLSTWYIPFAFLLFLVSPIFIKFIKIKKYHKRIIVGLLLMASIVHRPIHNLTINIFQALIYFAPIYCLGIYISMNRESFFENFKGQKKFFAIITMIILTVQISTGYFMNSHKNMLEFKHFDLMIFQKFFLCLFLVLFFNEIDKYFGNKVNFLFEILAKYSFPIFFIHNYLIQFLYPATGLCRGNGYIELVFLTIITLTLSIVFSYVIKTFFKNKSRMLIGG